MQGHLIQCSHWEDQRFLEIDRPSCCCFVVGGTGDASNDMSDLAESVSYILHVYGVSHKSRLLLSVAWSGVGMFFHDEIVDVWDQIMCL